VDPEGFKAAIIELEERYLKQMAEERASMEAEQ
jgi:hypothetical protein